MSATKDIYKNCTLIDLQNMICDGIDLSAYCTVTLCVEGKLDMLKYVVSLGALIDITCVQQVCYNGHLDVLKYMFDQLGPQVMWQIENIIPYYTKYYPFKHLHILKYLYQEQNMTNCEQMHNIHTYAKWIGEDFNIDVFYYMLLDMNMPIDKLVSSYDIYNLITYNRSDVISTLINNDYIESLGLIQPLIYFTIRNLHDDTNILELLFLTEVMQESYIKEACKYLNIEAIKYFYNLGYTTSTFILSNIDSKHSCELLLDHFKTCNDYSWQ